MATKAISMDDNTYSTLISRRVYVWAMQSRKPFQVTSLKDSFMQITMKYLEKAVEILIAEGKINEVAGGSRRIKSFEVIKFTDEYNISTAEMKEKVVTVKKKPLSEVKVNVPKSKSKNDDMKGEIVVPAVKKQKLTSKTEIATTESVPDIYCTAYFREKNSKDPKLLSLCSSVLEDFLLNPDYPGAEIAIPQLDFIQKVVPHGYTADDVIDILQFLDRNCKILLINENHADFIYRI